MMTRDELLAMHDEICGRAKGLMVRKNHDYAGESGSTPFANFEAAEQVGICSTEQGFLVRMMDKLKRLITFSHAGRLLVANEGFADACVDIINYAVLFAAYAGEKNQPLVRPRTAYIAGPMSGYPQFNFPAFDAARDALLAAGMAVISPADVDRQNGIDPMVDEQGVKDRLVREPELINEIIARDCAAILALRPGMDAVAVLPGWESSTGACAEVALARWRGVPVIDPITLKEVVPCRTSTRNRGSGSRRSSRR